MADKISAQTRPDKPHPAIRAHPSGSFVATIGGKRQYLGGWSDPAGAVAEYMKRKAAFDAGLLPAPEPGEMTIGVGINRYLNALLAQVEAGNLTARYLRDCKTALLDFGTKVGGSRAISNLGPADFTKHALGLSTQGLSPATRSRLIAIVRAMFNWLFQNNHVDALPRYGSSFSVSAVQMRKARNKAKALFTGEEIQKLISVANVQMKGMVLMAINAGYGNTDISDMQIGDIKDNMINAVRPKTGVKRVAVLWKETTDAIKDVLAARPRPQDPTDAGCVFLTSNGTRWVRAGLTEDRKGTTLIDGVGHLFTQLKGAAGMSQRSKKNPAIFLSDGRGFYHLRHTHHTWAMELGDRDACELIMGHVDGSISATYNHSMLVARLKKVADHLHGHVWPPRGKKRTSSATVAI
jgi:integrase